MRRSYLVICVAVVLATLAATAFSVRASDAPGVVPFGVRDSDLLQGTLNNGAYEIALDKLALEKSKNPAVLEIAKSSLAEHANVQHEVRGLAGARNTDLREELKADQSQRLAKLASYSGADFDQLYLMAMINLHAYDLQRIETLSANEKEVANLMSAAAKQAREHLTATRAALSK